MKKSDVASLVVYALMLVSLFLTFFFGAKDAIGVLNLGFGTIGIALGVIFISFIVGALFLELGHLLGAKVGKYKVILFNFFGFTFVKIDGKTKFRFKGPDGLISETQVAPKYDEEGKLISKPKAMLWFGNLFLAGLIIAGAIIYVLFQKNTKTIISPCALLATVSFACLLFYNFLPMELDNKTDGYQLKIVSKKANIEAYNESLRVKACEITGENPGEVKMFDEITSYTASVNLVTAYNRLAKDDYEGALKIINNIYDHQDDISEPLRLEMLAQRLYIYLYLNNIDKATKIYEDMSLEDKKFISNSKKLVFIRTYVLISAILDPAESEVQYATSNADRAYKRVEPLKKEVEAKLYKNAVKRVKELHPNWEAVVKDEKSAK
jgi:hypothetical protein